MRVTLTAVWGGDRGRTWLRRSRAMFGHDPGVIYVLGQQDGVLVLEAWSVDTGERFASRVLGPVVSGFAALEWLGETDDQVVVACQREPSERVLIGLDLRAPARVGLDLLRAGEHLVAVTPGLDFVLVREGTALRIKDRRSGSVVPLAMSTSPTSFSFDGSRVVWGVGCNEIGCWAGPQMTRARRWTFALASGPDLVAVERDGGAALFFEPPDVVSLTMRCPVRSRSSSGSTPTRA